MKGYCCKSGSVASQGLEVASFVLPTACREFELIMGLGFRGKGRWRSRFVRFRARS